MRSFFLASLVGLAAAAPAVVFSDGDAPACSIGSDGRTVVQFTKNMHPSFKCTQGSSGTTCSCTTTHPTHHKGGCRQFDHDGKTFSPQGDCSDAGAYSGTCANGSLLGGDNVAVFADRTQDNHCGSCDAGYYLDGTSCTAFAGSCTNGNLIAQASRDQDDHCGSCDAGYYLDGKSCTAFAGSCTNGNLIALTSRDQDDHCGSCDNGYWLNGKSCTAFAGSCTNGNLIALTSRDQDDHCG